MGMLMVPLVVPFQLKIDSLVSAPGLEGFVHYQFLVDIIKSPIFLVACWAFVEELFKFIAAYFAGIHTRDDDEPIDPLIYLITAALGFAAAENTLFVTHPLLDHNLLMTFATGNLRFMGSTLLHLVSSAAIGVSLGLVFYKKRSIKIRHIIAGLVIATTLHSFFNLFIMNTNGEATFTVFYGVWIAILVLVLLFEKLKTIKK
jgi:RsiW-degrading membrane proteinase PrsW (M82 family)